VNQSEHDYFLEDESDMNGIDIHSLIASRLEDMADQVHLLYTQGNVEDAELLRQEGLELAEAYDNGLSFFFVNDLSEI